MDTLQEHKFKSVRNFLKEKKPHILYILADDYGFSDIGYHNVSVKNHLSQNIKKKLEYGENSGYG